MKSKQKQTPTEIIENQRQAVVEKIIEDMKRDGLRWAEPYLPSLTPHNPVSGTVYQGGNRVHLGFIGFMRGYTDNRWATFNQIKDAGWHVKKVPSPRSSRNGNSSPSTRKTRIPVRRSLRDAIRSSSAIGTSSMRRISRASRLKTPRPPE